MGMRAECEAHLAAFSGLALGPDPSPMGFNDASGYVQTETQAWTIILADLGESLEDALERMLGYAATGILDAQTDVARLPLAPDRDGPASRREFQ